jgi:hypothetical protein
MTVYRLFDVDKGHFYIRRKREGSELATRRSLTIPIAHDKVDYNSHFEGLSRQEVQVKVGECLLGKFGPRLRPGEI